MLRLVLPLSLAVLAACSDPVRDDAIDALGPETGAQDENHRPGQPCVLCHSDGGPASGHPYAIGGTVYDNSDGKNGKEGAFVNFIDALGNGPPKVPQTNSAGNFFIRAPDWPDMAFPLRVGIYATEDATSGTPMTSNINRQGSCGYCHRPIPEGDSDAAKNAARSSAGPVYFTQGTTTTPASQ